MKYLSKYRSYLVKCCQAALEILSKILIIPTWLQLSLASRSNISKFRDTKFPLEAVRDQVHSTPGGYVDGYSGELMWPLNENQTLEYCDKFSNKKLLSFTIYLLWLKTY